MQRPVARIVSISKFDLWDLKTMWKKRTVSSQMSTTVTVLYSLAPLYLYHLDGAPGTQVLFLCLKGSSLACCDE